MLRGYSWAMGSWGSWLMGTSRNRFVYPDGLIRGPRLLVSLSDYGSISIVDGSKLWQLWQYERWHGDVEAGRCRTCRTRDPSFELLIRSRGSVASRLIS